MRVSCAHDGDDLDPNEYDYAFEPEGPDDDLDDLADRLAASAPHRRSLLVELEAGMTFLHDRFDADPDAIEVLGRVVELLVDRHRDVVRHVVHAAIALNGGPTAFAELEDLS